MKTESDPKAQTVTLCFEKALKVGEATLHLKFEGCINDKLAGLYQSKYTVSGPSTDTRTTTATMMCLSYIVVPIVFCLAGSWFESCLLLCLLG